MTDINTVALKIVRLDEEKSDFPSSEELERMKRVSGKYRKLIENIPLFQQYNLYYFFKDDSVSLNTASEKYWKKFEDFLIQIQMSDEEKIKYQGKLKIPENIKKELALMPEWASWYAKFLLSKNFKLQKISEIHDWFFEIIQVEVARMSSYLYKNKIIKAEEQYFGKEISENLIDSICATDSPTSEELMKTYAEHKDFIDQFCETFEE